MDQLLTEAQEEEMWIKPEPVDEDYYNIAETDPLTVEKHIDSESVHIKLETECGDSTEWATSTVDKPANNNQTQTSGTSSYECTECGMTYSRKCHLTIHLRTHSDEKPLAGMKFPQGKPHKRKHTDERPYSCHPCKSHFAYKESLEQHMKKEQHHKAVAAAAAAVSALCNRIFPCDDCDKTFTRDSDLQIHRRRHEIIFDCDECGKVFSRRQHLHRHKITHSDPKPFACDICKKRFSQSGYLNSHKIKHVNDSKHDT